jgi:cytochrome bd ubiquinol oxidase subunit II
METLWFCLIALTLTVYVVLDGFDLGAGTIHLFVAKTGEERAAVIRAVSPVWDGNEVWLVVTAATLFAVFPPLYAAAFSGFYLQLMMVLWLLVGRALGIEFRHQTDSPLWTSAWDVIFALSSGTLALFFGIALGNVARGVPIGADGNFFAPLWTDFSPYRGTGLLDGYTLLAGVTALAALVHHGALWTAIKTEGALHDRCRRAAGLAGWATVASTVLVTLWTRSVQPHMATRFSDHPWGFLFPLVAAGGLAAAIVFRRKGRDGPAFLGSTAYLAGMMASVAFSLYPYVLPSTMDRARGLTVQAAASSPESLKIALAWWLPGMALAGGYVAFVYRKFAGKVSSDTEHY